MNLSDFKYHLPEDLIAQEPVYPREASRLMCFDGQISHKRVANLLDMLSDRHVLVFNSSKIIPARIRFGNHEILLSKRNWEDWEVMVRIWKKNRPWDRHMINDQIGFEILAVQDAWTRIIRFFHIDDKPFDFDQFLSKAWEMPSPPYIKRKLTWEEYKPEFSSQVWFSVASPTAGLHFSSDFISQLKAKWVQIEFVHLDVWLWTFLPVKNEDIDSHYIHSENISLDHATACRLNHLKSSWASIVAVWTTTVRVLEHIAWLNNWELKEYSGQTNIFIRPWYKFRFVNELITNFHLPWSTLIMLVSALIWREKTMELYDIAIKEKYRFYSLWDAMYLKSSQAK